MKIYNVIHIVDDSLDEIKSFNCEDAAVCYALSLAATNGCEYQAGRLWTAKGQSIEVVETILIKEHK